MVEPATVRRLVETIEQRLLRLGRPLEATPEENATDADLQDIAERNLQVCIQACIDLGLHVLADRPEPLPETYRRVFRALAEVGIIEAGLARQLESMLHLHRARPRPRCAPAARRRPGVRGGGGGSPGGVVEGTRRTAPRAVRAITTCGCCS